MMSVNVDPNSSATCPRKTGPIECIIHADTGYGTGDLKELGRGTFTLADVDASGLECPLAPRRTQIFIAKVRRQEPPHLTEFRRGIDVIGVRLPTHPLPVSNASPLFHDSSGGTSVT
jgi:hypothetical protein